MANCSMEESLAIVSFLQAVAVTVMHHQNHRVKQGNALNERLPNMSIYLRGYSTAVQKEDMKGNGQADTGADTGAATMQKVTQTLADLYRWRHGGCRNLVRIQRYIVGLGNHDRKLMGDGEISPPPPFWERGKRDD